MVDAAVHDGVGWEEDQESLGHNSGKVHYIQTRQTERERERVSLYIVSDIWSSTHQWCCQDLTDRRLWI